MSLRPCASLVLHHFRHTGQQQKMHRYSPNSGKPQALTLGACAWASNNSRNYANPVNPLLRPSISSARETHQGTGQRPAGPINLGKCAIPIGGHGVLVHFLPGWTRFREAIRRKGNHFPTITVQAFSDSVGTFERMGTACLPSYKPDTLPPRGDEFLGPVKHSQRWSDESERNRGA